MSGDRGIRSGRRADSVLYRRLSESVFRKMEACYNRSVYKLKGMENA